MSSTTGSRSIDLEETFVLVPHREDCITLLVREFFVSHFDGTVPAEQRRGIRHFSRALCSLTMWVV